MDRDTVAKLCQGCQALTTDTTATAYQRELATNANDALNALLKSIDDAGGAQPQ